MYLLPFSLDQHHQRTIWFTFNKLFLVLFLFSVVFCYLLAWFGGVCFLNFFIISFLYFGLKGRGKDIFCYSLSNFLSWMPICLFLVFLIFWWIWTINFPLSILCLCPTIFDKHCFYYHLVLYLNFWGNSWDI